MFPSATIMLTDRATYCGMHQAATEVVAEAFMLAAEYEPDEKIPLWPTETAIAVLTLEGEPCT